MLLIIDNYDSFTYNLYQYFSELGCETQVVRNDAITIQEIEELAPDALVISLDLVPQMTRVSPLKLSITSWVNCLF
ncbi:para-aminobenzoate synthase [Vibrio ishigakensis]|uniref:Para-aminobenzoate synthase n=1 Tax=Vibrio ishigakensis TaxID=1481914 RepID=A0A0B8QQD6_9VIBR|nr:para-aminobenzoate synthase [Vibrio ishigakensis]